MDKEVLQSQIHAYNNMISKYPDFFYKLKDQTNMKSLRKHHSTMLSAKPEKKIIRTPI